MSDTHREPPDSGAGSRPERAERRNPEGKPDSGPDLDETPAGDVSEAAERFADEEGEAPTG